MQSACNIFHVVCTIVTHRGGVYCICTESTKEALPFGCVFSFVHPPTVALCNMFDACTIGTKRNGNKQSALFTQKESKELSIINVHVTISSPPQVQHTFVHRHWISSTCMECSHTISSGQFLIDLLRPSSWETKSDRRLGSSRYSSYRDCRGRSSGLPNSDVSIMCSNICAHLCRTSCSLFCV